MRQEDLRAGRRQTGLRDRWGSRPISIDTIVSIIAIIVTLIEIAVTIWANGC